MTAKKLKKYILFTLSDLAYFNVYCAYADNGNNFFVEVEENGMVYYPEFEYQEDDIVFFRGWI